VITQAWLNAWEYVIPFLAFPPEVRRVIYTTDESVKAAGHRQCRVVALACVVGVVDPRAKRRIWGWCLPRSCCPV
jgi:hypothetical protein